MLAKFFFFFLRLCMASLKSVRQLEVSIIDKYKRVTQSMTWSRWPGPEPLGHDTKSGCADKLVAISVRSIVCLLEWNKLVFTVSIRVRLQIFVTTFWFLYGSY